MKAAQKAKVPGLSAKVASPGSATPPAVAKPAPAFQKAAPQGPPKRVAPPKRPAEPQGEVTESAIEELVHGIEVAPAGSRQRHAVQLAEAVCESVFAPRPGAGAIPGHRAHQCLPVGTSELGGRCSGGR